MLTVKKMITYCNQNLSNIKFVNLLKKDLIDVEKSYNQDLNMPPPSGTHENFTISQQCHQLDLL